MSSNVQTPPRKNARIGKGATSDGPYRSLDDGSVTPRPTYPLLNRLNFPLPSTLAAAAGADSVAANASSPSSIPSSRSSAYSAESRGSKRKRSTSPTKQIEERQYAKYPIAHYAVDGADDVDDRIQEAVMRVRRVGRAKGVLPLNNAEWATLLSAGDDELAKDLVDAENNDRVAPDPVKVRRIVTRASRNAASGASEAAWNSGVHAFLLEEAYIGSGVDFHLVWENITTASIIPDLVPEKDDAERADSKKVDFCVALSLNEYQHVGQKLYQDGVRYLNQTEYGPVRYKPIALSIETKLGGEGGVTALVQLSTWATAQIAQIRKLLQWNEDPAAHPIPPLPLLVVQGHTWSLYLFEHEYERQGGNLWSCGQFGSTETLLGAYQVIAALQVLMRWAADVYRPWFVKNILQPRGLGLPDG